MAILLVYSSTWKCSRRSAAQGRAVSLCKSTLYPALYQLFKKDKYMRLSTCPRGAWQKDFSVISSLVSTGFISFLLLFFPHGQLCECEYVSVWEKVGLEKAHLSFTGNYWLGLELRNKISHGNQSHFGLCHIFHSVQLFPFATPFFFFTPDPIHSGRQVLKVGRQGGCTHHILKQISNSSSESSGVYFL